DLKSGFLVELIGYPLSSQTNSSGYFEINNIPANSAGYTIKISKANYLNRQISGIIVTSDLQIGSQSEPIKMWAGDMQINGVQDNAINMTDIMEFARHFNSISGDERYSISSDINRDSAVNMSDIVIVVKHFNQTPLNYPIVTINYPPSNMPSIKSGVTWYDNNGNPVNAHGGGIWYENGKYYLYGEYCSAGSELFTAMAMYSSTDLMNWTFERKILTVQASGELGPNRIGQRPHIIKCPSTGEYVMFIHAADKTYQADKEIVYATCSTINGDYTYKGSIKNSSGVEINRSDFTAYQDGNTGYICTESGFAYKLASDYHSWTEITLNGASALNGKESPTILKVDGTYYWLWSNKTGWRSNDNGYATASSMAGPWTNRGLIAPSGMFTWDSQCTYALPVNGTVGKTYLYCGDRWEYGDNSKATYVWQPLTVNGTTVSMPEFYPSWNIDIAKGTWFGKGSTNLANGKTVSSDSSLSSNPASNGNDGDASSTRWCAADTGTGHWWKVDLVSICNITNTSVTWEKPNVVYKYKIEVSTDDLNWITKVDKTKSTSKMQTQSDSFTASARYVRVTVTGMPSSTDSASFYEFRVLGY
ncbi:MAG: discoidin domain-containing protein, partial [Bacillota bacterium]|nr:discoidin domain-containing protein [Bacillota bacterium]